MDKIKHILFFLLLLPGIFLSQRLAAHHFTALTVNDGLSQNTVLTIAQDRQGRMWFGTMDGLNLYDGYQFRVYRNHAEDSLSLADNMVRKVFFDEAGHLWIGTESGLSFLENSMETFRNFRFGFPVHDIAQISGNYLLLATAGGLEMFDIPNMEMLEIDNEVLASVHATALFSQGSIIYIGTEDGSLFSFSKDRLDIRKIAAPGIAAPVNALQVQDDLLWVATEGEGLFRLSLKTGEMERWSTYSSQKLLSNYIRALHLDKKGKLWIGSFSGLEIYQEGSISRYESDPFEPGSLSQNSVRAIFEDRDGGMWLGTYFGGLNYSHPLNNRFSLMTRLPKENSLNDNVISCIVEDRDHSLWIGTNSGGVNHFIPTLHRFEHYKFTPNSTGLESNDIKAIWLDEKTGKVYIGAHAGGLSVLDRKTGRLSSISFGAHRLVNIYVIAPKTDRELWLGSLEGLYSLDKISGRLQPCTTDLEGNKLGVSAVEVLMHDSEGRLWIGGNDGVEVYDVVSGGLRRCDFTRNGFLKKITHVNSMIESADNAIWIGCREGLYRVLPATGGLLHYTTENGLPNNIVTGIEEDRSGRLWLGTDYGLCCFNPYSSSFRNFTIEDGLQGNQFNKYAHCFTEDGKMYFGGINGLTSFFPDRMSDNPYSPNPIITELKVFGKRITAGDASGILSEDISMTSEVRLGPGQNTLTLGYSVPNYLSGGKDSFSYKLEGFDQDWYQVEGKRTVTYSNLPAGDYRFLLKAANNDGIWNETPTELHIIIAPEWYRSVWAKIGFSLLFLLILFLVMKFLMERANMKNRLMLDEQEKEHQEELHQMKMRFFINISHELRTPLTLILNPLQELIVRESDTWKRKRLKYIEANAQRLLHLVNQLMDYRRAELGVFKLHVKGEDVHKLIKENWSFYEKLAQSRKIRYTLSSEVEGRTCYVDGQYLELILNNLLSNAFKYTESGQISVHAAMQGEDLVLEVRDTGTGMPPEVQEKIFERFYQGDSEHIGSGIGLSLVHRLVELHHGQIRIESKVGEGSLFTVTFPQQLNAYTEEELRTTEASAEGYKSSSKEIYINDFEPQEEIVPIKTGGHKARLLVAENNDEVRHYMRSVLSSMFEVKTVKNGQEALDYLQSAEVDLIVTDLMMPVIGGDKLCAHVKQNITTSHIPVIIVSAKTDPKDQLEALKSGADAYIFKPFSMNVLIVRIQNMLRTSMRISDRASKSMDILPEKISFNAMDEQLLNQAIEVVQRNLDNVSFSTEEFAQEMNMSRSNLHLKLKALTGESALDFIRKVRFKEACKLLKDGRYSISEVSDMVGFSTPSYFATSFKKHMGCLPTEYIKQHNG